jgi:hypothetical protein
MIEIFWNDGNCPFSGQLIFFTKFPHHPVEQQKKNLNILILQSFLEEEVK